MKQKKRGMAIIGAVIVLLLLIAVPLGLSNPSAEQFKESVPASFYTENAEKINEVYNNGGIISSYVVTKQISSVRAERRIYLGIAGQVFEADNGALQFVCNCIAWMPNLLSGTWVMISLTVCSVIVGVILSIFLALGKMSKVKLLRWFCEAYIFFFRGTPLLMQLFFVYYGLPLLNPALSINSRFMAAWLAFSLNSGAYCAEIIRAAIQSIDKGQFEAAKVLGFSYGRTMRKIIIPQTYRRLIPPIANEFIMVLKDASLTSLIALQDLSKVTQSIMTSTNQVSVYIPSMAIYLVITAVFTKVFNDLEKKFSVYE